MKGRKPTPTALRLIAGNPSGRPMNKDEPEPLTELYAPPETMSPSQQAIWRHAIENAPKGLLRGLDSQLLSIWVVAADLHQTARQQIQTFGLMVKSPTQGIPMQSPYVPILNKQAEIMMKAASELGFSPTSRSRITLAGGGKQAVNRFSNNAAKRRA